MLAGTCSSIVFELAFSKLENEVALKQNSNWMLGVNGCNFFHLAFARALLPKAKAKAKAASAKPTPKQAAKPKAEPKAKAESQPKAKMAATPKAGSKRASGGQNESSKKPKK